MGLTGLFKTNNFRGKNVLKLAPDAFVVMNNSFGTNIISPMDSGGVSKAGVPGDLAKGTSMQGGITSINVSTAVAPAGCGRATIEVVAPQYKGLHADYFIDMPNGVRVPYFIPMTEVKIYMKARFIQKDPSHKSKPHYYPVFWGYVSGITESYNNGISNFTLNCVDLLNFWANQKVTLTPSVGNVVQGAAQRDSAPTIFQFLNPWETIYALFLDTEMVKKTTDGGSVHPSNWVYGQFSSLKTLPLFLQTADGSVPDGGKIRDALGALALNANKYWQERFGFRNALLTDGSQRTDGSVTSLTEVEAAAAGKAPLEMMGLSGAISTNDVRDTAISALRDGNKLQNRTTKSDVKIDFSLLARVLPYGQFSAYGDGNEPTIHSKLDIANKVCDDTHMEFFLDTNGSFVFKPPLYNLDVASGTDQTYTIKAEDIINSTFGYNSDAIVNFLEVTGPAFTGLSETYNGVHIDYESIKMFGLRNQTLAMSYGNTPETLRAIAISEMSRINSKATTGTLSIPLRPEMRLGYPVYIPHIDAFYYVSGISHSFSFGSGATTELSLEARRERAYDDGTITGIPGSILKGYVTRIRKTFDEIFTTGGMPTDKQLEAMKGTQGTKGSEDSIVNVQNQLRKNYLKMTAGLTISNESQGQTKIEKASAVLARDNVIAAGKPENGEEIETPAPIRSNELVHITKKSVPYSDINGYRHIGAFPYGANLRLDTKSEHGLVDLTDKAEALKSKANILLNIAPATRAD